MHEWGYCTLTVHIGAASKSSAAVGAISFGSTIQLFQSLALHLQLHLRILLEDLRVGLAKHLRYPLVGYSSGTQPCGVRGAKIVDPKVGNLCSSKSSSPNCLERRLVPARNPIARKQKRPFTRNRHLTLECFDGEGSEGNLGDAVRSLRIRYPGYCVLQVQLVLPHRSQFLVDPQPGFRDDSNHVPQIPRTMRFDSLLLRPRNVMRSEQSLNGNRKLNTSSLGASCGPPR